MSKCNSKTFQAIDDGGLTLEQEEKILGQRDLPVIRLMQANSTVVVKKQVEGVDGGHYLLDRRLNLGESFEAVVGPSRAHAIKRRGLEVELESFTMGSPTFKTIVEMEKQDARGVQHGLQFLLWLPFLEQFAVFGFYNASRRAAGPAIFCRQADRLATFKARLVQGRRYNFFQPHVDPCNLDPGSVLVMPSPRELSAALSRFESRV